MNNSNGTNGRSNGENRGRNGHVLVWEQPGLEEEDRPIRKRKSTSARQAHALARVHSFVYVEFCVRFSRILDSVSRLNPSSIGRHEFAIRTKLRLPREPRVEHVLPPSLFALLFFHFASLALSFSSLFR